MFPTLCRAAAGLSLRARFSRCAALAILILTMMFAVAAQAVVVRGRATDALCAPVPGAYVRLMQNGKVVAYTYAGADGGFEIRAAEAGRFNLFASGATFLPSLGEDFYGGATDVLERDVVLASNSVRQDVTVTATGIATPLPQLTAPISVLQAGAFTQDLGVTDALRMTPGAFVVQTGQTGGVASLFLRGGNSTANLVLVDGVPADDVGGVFDFGPVSSTAVGAMELYRGPDSAVYGTDAGAGVITINTPRGTTTNPVLNYSGQAGNLHTWRNEASLGGTLQKLDYFGAFSRLDTSNAVAMDRYHAGTEAINVGYDFNGNTQARLTIRNGDAVQGVPGPYDFDGVSENGRQADQDLFSGVTIENRYKGNWHNLLRYGIARKREQAAEYGNVGNYLAYDPGQYGPGYVGNVVTIRGANGSAATGQVQLYTGNFYDQDSNRDQLYYQSDYSLGPHLTGLFGFRYDRERGSYNDYYPAYSYSENEKIQRTNFEYNLQFQGEFWSRLFYSAGGAVEKSHLYGIAGTPRLGLSYVPVRSSTRYFHGTRLRANAATGVQEPSLSLEYNSLDTLLTQGGYTSLLGKNGIGPQGAERSRTYDVGVDQNLIGNKLVLKAGYFHNVFDHQIEGVNGNALIQYLQFPNVAPFNTPYFTAYVNSMAFRAQGAEVELEWRPKASLFVRGGYTNLSARVLQSFSSDAVAGLQGTANANPNFPNTPIGIFGPLVGARPFRRAPNTGYFDVQYTHSKLAVTMRGAMASRSDDSTYLEYDDLNGDNTLLLPNHDLDFGYVKLDLGAKYALKHGFTWFGQAENLLNDQHIGPIGYPGLPLTFRTGLQLRLGGD
jgi:vitamin B12 transporter